MTLTYRKSGVSYQILDPFKRLAQQAGRKTLEGTKLREVSQSRGESAYVWEERDCYRAFVTEGLGTKSLVADEMRKVTGKTYYDTIAQDTVAMIVNDLIVVGATPQVISAYFAVGDSGWFGDKKRVADLIQGWTIACNKAGAVWGGGETPTLKDSINPDAIDLAGTAVGVIRPKSRLTLGDKLAAGDAIILVKSSGIHANGLTLARSIAENLPRGYATKLPDGALYGESLLQPTHIYSRVVEDLFAKSIDIHYMVHITGHGWRKIMRANRRFTYVIDTLPAPHPVFTFLQKHSGSSDRDMYATFNMGAGFVLFLPKDQAKRAQTIIAGQKLQSWVAGVVEKGPKQVIIHPKNIIFQASSLQVR